MKDLQNTYPNYTHDFICELHLIADQQLSPAFHGFYVGIQNLLWLDRRSICYLNEGKRSAPGRMAV